jgi:hypothetical protein
MSPRVAVRALACALSASLLVPAPAAGAPSAKRRARVAVRFLVSRQTDAGAVPAFSEFGSTADAVVSMLVAKRAPRAIRRALRWLRLHHYQADGVGLKAKLVMALSAAGRDARAFAGHDWVGEIQATEEPSGRYGSDTPVLEHALALLALQAAAAPPSDAAASWLAAAQCADGGWQYDEPYDPPTEDVHCQAPDGAADPFSAEADATGYAVQALAAAGVDPNRDPFDFFRLVRDPVKRGWGYNQTFSLTSANSTALVLQAYAAEGVEPPKRGVRALRRLQYRLCGRGAGAFAYSWVENGDGYRRTGRDVGATIGAIPGVLSQPFPISERDATRPAPTPGRC